MTNSAMKMGQYDKLHQPHIVDIVYIVHVYYTYITVAITEKTGFLTPADTLHIIVFCGTIADRKIKEWNTVLK